MPNWPSGHHSRRHGELTLKRASVVYPPVIQPYRMKEFAVRDPNGYVLGFGQEWPTASAAAS